MDDVRDARKGRRRVVAFELQTGGHHPGFIHNFAQAWLDADIPAEIDFVVTQTFFDKHPSVVDFVRRILPDRVRIHSLDDTQQSLVEPLTFWRDFYGWKIFCDWAHRLESTDGLLMFSDRFQLPMLLGRQAPCRISCIYFRPSFHYHTFRNYRPSWKAKFTALRKALLLRQFLRLDTLDTIFTPDMFAPDYINSRMPSKARICQVPDTFINKPTTDAGAKELRSTLGVESHRRVLLLLGVLDSRKGPCQLLDAVAALPTDAQRRLCLLLVGSVDPTLKNQVQQRVDKLQSLGTSQVILKDEYVTDTYAQHCYELADVVLTTYQWHIGDSSALIRAGYAGKPVLSSGYGLIGELVTEHRLGIVTNTASHSEFVRSLQHAITQPVDQLFEQASARKFVSQHTPEALAETLRRWICGKAS